MRQLGELKNHTEQFSAQGTEVIAVFREEKEGVAGLQKIQDRMEVDFTLCLDTGTKKTSRYSPGKMEFTSYVVDSGGVIRGVITGDLRNRANAKQLLEVLDGLNGDE